MQLNYSEGCYNLFFFNINIKTNEQLSEDILRKEGATFLHEFIHYLQDLVLPYNIRCNLSNVRFFYNILEVAHNTGCINRPFSEWNHESSILKIQKNRTFGKPDFVNNVCKIGNAVSDFETISGFDGNLSIQRTHRVYQYSIPVWEVGNSIPIHYGLGARDILEYIAYKIEKKFFPNRPPAPQLPYHSIDLIFEKYGLSNVSDDKRLCVAECCLYNDAPIHFLFNVMLGNEGFREFIINSSYEDIYFYLMSSCTLTRDGNSESLTAKTQRRLTQFANDLQIQYSGFADIVKWIQAVNDYVEQNLSGRFVFSDIYKMNSLELYNFVCDLFSHIGVPLIMNSKEQAISIIPNNLGNSQFIQFYIMQKFLSFVQSDHKKCPIYDFCKANYGLCNNNCSLNAQKTIDRKVNCSFGQFLGTHQLLDMKIN